MKKIFLLLNLSLICQLVTFAQKDYAAKYAATITAADLKKHLTIIASDEMEGRETGTEGQRKAAAYIESQFKQMGLTPAAALKGYQQLYPLYQDSLSSGLMVNNKAATYGTDYISPAASNETGANKATAIIFAGYGIDDKNYSDYDSIDVKDKIVVFFLGEPKNGGNYLVSGTNRSSQWSYPGLSVKLATAMNRGAAGAFVINPLQETFTQRSIDNSKKTNVYFPHENAGKPVNYALLSHAYPKYFLSRHAKATHSLQACLHFRVENTRLFFCYCQCYAA